MDDILDITFTGLCRYFKILSNTGYLPYKEVNKLIIILFIEELLDKQYYFITEDDYRLITNAIYSITSHSCLLELPKNLKDYDNFINTKLYATKRLTEDDLLRFTQIGDARILDRLYTHDILKSEKQVGSCICDDETLKV